MQYVICISRDGLGDFCADDLTLGRRYAVLAPADAQGMVRVVDDSGEDYLYPEALFVAADEQAGPG